ncbi:hypothetical protein GCM10011498_01530 [Amylibacter cionae]|uniref:Uncharacterized protein n=1 Tax=Neptunicoccus cionae TaxID=2035344 RepID=A0A916QPF6_9RHOB|nr:hypothetical protein GCM10011498_01530 [Amylibacter cionae]
MKIAGNRVYPFHPVNKPRPWIIREAGPKPKGGIHMELDILTLTEISQLV